MNDSTPTGGPAANAGPEEKTAAVFHAMIAQQTNMALMFMGRLPHPETGQSSCDLEAAQFFIDQLEMLEVKTKGNLHKDEEALLKQALTVVRMAFVEAVEQPGSGEPAPQSEARPPEAAGPPSAAEAGEAGKAAAEESRKKFSKKYD